MAEEREAADLQEITGAPPPEGGEAVEGETPEPNEGAAPEGEEEGGKADEPEKLKPTTPRWVKDRIDRATRQKGEAERKAEAERQRAERAEENAKRLRALLEADGKELPADEPPAKREVTSAEDIERRASEIAERRAQEQRVAAESARVMEAGLKEFGADKWESARSGFVENFGEELKARPEFFDAIFGVDGGHKVFYDLANDPDEAARVLALSPARIGVEVARLAAKEKPARRESQAPKPLTPVNGAAKVARTITDPDLSMEDFIRLREEQIQARRRA